MLTIIGVFMFFPSLTQVFLFFLFCSDGFFFAVKEVSLLDQGGKGKQSIYQLEQEISLLSQLEHENIVRYYGTNKDDSKLYIFLELVTKGSLLSLYQKYHLQESQASVYTKQILNGLKYLHEQNVVHRDIKCANILVDVHGSVKIADFGLAKATKLNDVKSCRGTPFWMAPEVVNWKNEGYGLATDIWSLGCTVLEMLTRRPPYSHLEGVGLLDLGYIKKKVQSEAIYFWIIGTYELYFSLFGECHSISVLSWMSCMNTMELSIFSFMLSNTPIDKLIFSLSFSRDIKCANILVGVNKSVKIADFGLAKATKLNDVKSFKGTLRWMAPEVFNQKNEGYGLAVNIWSLGCTVLEMLTCRPPYSNMEDGQVISKIYRSEPPDVPDSFSSDARDFILKCLQVNPSDRPTAGELLDHPFVKRPSGPQSPRTSGIQP
ncbi:unnamed protein product, partial [Vitis vinifera]